MVSAPDLDGWPSALKERRKIPLNTENESWLQSRARFGESDNNDTYQIFMRGPSDPFGRIPRAAKFEELFSGTSLDSLREAERKEDGSLRLIAWRDDRNFETKSAVSSARCKPLTAYGLFLDLIRHRFPSADIPSGTALGGPNDQVTDQIALSLATELDADRRLIFITDLDRYTIFALVWTAPAHQVPALRKALYNHLNFKASLEMTARINRFPPFELAFHLPFFVLKTSTTKQGARRQSSNEPTLRRSTNVSFLNGPTTICSEWLHEAQISCLVTGSDESRWVAHLWVDTSYFDPNDEDREDVFEYETDAREDSGMHADPLTYGVDDANTPIWDPRTYFLTVFARRLPQVRREWERVVMRFSQRIRAFEETLHDEMTRLRPSNPSEKKKIELDLHYSHCWVVKTKHVTDRLRQGISRTIKVCEPFCSEHPASGDGPLRFPQGHRLLADVHTTFGELCQLEDDLKDLVHSCGLYEKELEALLHLEAATVSARQLELTTDAIALNNQQLQLSTDQLKLGEKQSQIAKESKGFSWIMMLYVSPIALTASIFSMQETVLPNVLPFIRPTVGWFFGLIGIFELLGLIVHAAWSCQWIKVVSVTRTYCDGMKSILPFSNPKSPPNDLEGNRVIDLPHGSNSRVHNLGNSGSCL
jgi:hypothetical protein